MTVIYRKNRHEKEVIQPPKYKTLADKEKKLALEKRKAQKIFDLLGRETDIPIVMKGKKMNVNKMHPETLLKLAGYKRNGTRGWVRYINPLTRFHSYFNIQGTVLSLHIDKVVDKRHRATGEGIEMELERLQKIMKKGKAEEIIDYLNNK